MKNIHFKTFTLGILVMCLLNLSSCGKETNSKLEDETGARVGYRQKVVALANANSKTINFSNIDDYKNKPGKCIRAWCDKSLSSQEITQILDSFHIGDITHREYLLGAIVFNNKDSVDYNLDNKLVYGVMVITYDSNGFMHG